MKLAIARFATAAALAACLFAQGGVAKDAGEKEGDGKVPAVPVDKDVTQGALRIQRPDGSIVESPLKHTDVDARISGFIGRVKVTQTFFNPLDEKIEAVYVFPLPHKAGVDGMTMVVGDRRIVGLIKRRNVAREIYEEALRQGQTAALLEQERPNIFTQSVGNIGPKQEVKVEITYVDVLDYDMGVYAFHFPMVVGPRFIPGTPTSQAPALPSELKGSTSTPEPNTDRVPDASRITPPYMKPDVRNGHDISLAVELDAGVPVQNLEVINHKADVDRSGSSRAKVKLDPADSLPNKDFVLRYKVVGEKPEMAVLGTTDEQGRGYFMLMIQPKEDERLKESPPREIYFVVDVSGSMSGEPTALVKRTMESFLKLCKTKDTVQVVTFAGAANELFPKAVPVTEENIKAALDFTRGINAGGGTQMLEGIKKVMNAPADPDRVRIAIMLTDGFIGNEAEIIKEVGERCGDRIRFWAVGIGSSPNRFLIDGVAKQGGGMGKALALTEDPMPLVQEVMFRIHRAQLSDIRINWGSLRVHDVMPVKMPELWAGRPVIVFGRYDGGGEDTVVVSGKVEGQPADWPLTVSLPRRERDNEVLAKVWARNLIEELMQQTYYAGSPAIEEEVTLIALEYGLMSQYTSFVAVDAASARGVQSAQPPRRMLVPVPIPAGTQWEGFFGPTDGDEGEAKDLGRQIAQGGVVPAPRQDKLASGGWGKRREQAGAPLKGMYAYGSADRKTKEALRPAASRVAATTTMPGRGLLATEESCSDGIALGDAPFRGGDLLPFAQALAGQIGELQKQADAILVKAEELRKAGKGTEAREMCARAYMLEMACASRGAGMRETAASSLEKIDEINRELTTAWAGKLPALDKDVNIILRDLSAEEAVRALGKAAGLTVRFAAGSEKDAAAAIERASARVSYLDLTGVKARVALDWLLRPLRMSWRVETIGGEQVVIAGTSRRLDGESAWVYDVAAMMQRTADEKGNGDFEAQKKAIKADADAFMAAIRKGLGTDEGAMTWFGMGEVLLWADAKTHRAAEEMFAKLANPAAKLEGQLAALQRTTCRRASANAKELESFAARREKAAVESVMIAFSWKLMAEAAKGVVNTEALAELSIAWRSAEAADMLSGDGALPALRSAWAITEAAEAVQRGAAGRGELVALSGKVRGMVKPGAEKVVEFSKQNPALAPALLQAIYASLVMSEDREFIKNKALPLLVRSGGGESSQDDLRTVAAALLNPGEEARPARLALIVKNGKTVGEDAVVLTAFACRMAGGVAWEHFREASRDILGGQPLPGIVTVLINRLDGGVIAVAAR